VEVKGLSGPAARIQLTANDLEHAQSCPHVVSGIGLADVASAGSGGCLLDLRKLWTLDESRLRATEYSYSPR
jgi:hypothetical protein